MAAFSIVGELLMKTGSFETDTARAQKSVASLSKEFKAFQASFAGNLLADFAHEAIHALAELPGKMLESVAAFKDLSEATGASVENISALDRVARENGISFDAVQGSLVKLNKALLDTNPNSPAANALKAIGLSADELRKLDPAEAFRKIAVALSGFANDGDKARAVQILFNKSLLEVAPLLDKLARTGALVASTTTDQAIAVEEYRKRTFQLKADIEDLARAFTISLIPVLIDATAKIKELFNVGPATAGTVGKEVADLETQLKQLKDVGGGFSVLGFFGTESQRKERIAQVEKELKDARARFQKAIAGTSTAGAGRGFVNPALPSVGTVDTNKGPKDDPTKKLLEDRLKAIQVGIDREKDLFQTRNEFIDLYNSQNLLSIDDYYAARKVAQDDANSAEIKGITEQIAAIRRYQAQIPADDPQANTKRAAEEAKVTDLIGKRAKIELDAGKQAILSAEQQRFAYENFLRTLAGVNAQVLDLQENFAEAAAVKFDLQFDALSKTFSANGNQAGLAAVATLRAAAIAQAEFQKASVDSGRALDDLSRQEQYLAIQQQVGAKSEIETLALIGQARRAQIPLLEAQVAAQEAIAKASGNQILIQNAENARLALEKLKATVDPLAEKLNGIFGDAFSNAFTDFVMGTQTASQAFHSFTRSVINDLVKIASQQLAKQIFGGSVGGLGGFLSSLLNGSGQGINNTGTSLPTAGGAASGTNFVERDMLTILHKGEAVVPKAYNPVTGGGKGTVINISNRGQPVSAREESRQDTDQGTIINLVLDAVARDVQQGGKTHRAIAGTYGVSRAAGAPKRG